MRRLVYALARLIDRGHPADEESEYRKDGVAKRVAGRTSHVLQGHSAGLTVQCKVTKTGHPEPCPVKFSPNRHYSLLGFKNNQNFAQLRGLVAPVL